MTRQRSSSHRLELLREISAPVTQELAKAIALLGLMIVSVWCVLEILRGVTTAGSWYERLWHTFSEAAIDVNGLPIASRFFPAAGRSLAIVLPAAAMLGFASLGFGSWFALRPSSSVLRFPLGILSAVPAFMFPFLGIPQESAWFWPAVCLAIGDLNLAAQAAHCYDGVRRELNQPYVRTARSQGLSVWSDLWPRASLIALEGIRSRIPHLLGGTVAIEHVYNIHGIGHLALSSVLSSRPDYNTLIWIAGLGIVATRALSLAHRMARLFLTPERSRSSAWSGDGLAASLVSLWRVATTRAEGSRAPTHDVAWLSAAALPASVTRPAWLTRATLRVRSFARLSKTNRLKLMLAIVTVSSGTVLGALALWGGPRTMLDTAAPVLSASWSHPLGTNEMGEDVLSTLALGGRDLIVPLMVAVATALVLGGLFGTLAGLCLGSLVDVALDLYAELWESIPKLVLVFAAITYMSFAHYVLKTYFLIGLAFAPLLYRTVRDEVGALRTSLFLEASITLGVSRSRILWTHVLRGHVLPVMFVQGAVLVGYLLLFDAILGYCGVRQYGEVFTWGSLLGTALDELPRQLDAGVASNSLTVWGPFVAMLIAITCSTVAGDALKSMGRSVRFNQ